MHLFVFESGSLVKLTISVLRSASRWASGLLRVRPRISVSPNCLARLLNKEVEGIGRIRKVDGSPPQYSMVDVIRSITGQSLANVKHTLDDVCRRDIDVCDNMTNIPLNDSTGLQKQKTTVLCVLPCKKAFAVRRRASDVMARYLGGDLTMVVNEIFGKRAAYQQAND